MSTETKWSIQAWAFIIGWLAFIAMLSFCSAHDRQMWRERAQAAQGVAHVR